MPRGHVHQQVYSWRCQEAVYINADVLVHECGLVNHTRRHWAASGIHNRTSKREYTLGRSTCCWYSAKIHRARDANLLYVSAWLLHQLKGSSVWTPKQRHCWILRFGVELKVPYRCSMSIVLPFSVTEQSNHYFHRLMVSRRRPEKLRCIDWWSAKVSLNLRFGQKPAARWWNFGGGAPFLHFRRRRRHNYFGGGGATGVGLYFVLLGNKFFATPMVTSGSRVRFHLTLVYLELEDECHYQIKQTGRHSLIDQHDQSPITI